MPGDIGYARTFRDYWVHRVQPKLALVSGWARNGATDSQIYQNLGISETTWYRFLKEHEELNDALVEGRRDAEVLVENALFKRACGYKYKEVTKERKKVFDEDGKWTGQFEFVTVKKVLKEVVPDVGAQQYWLEHRATQRWPKQVLPGIDVGAVTMSLQGLASLLANPVPERKVAE